VFKAHRLVYHPTLGSRVIKKEKMFFGRQKQNLDSPIHRFLVCKAHRLLYHLDSPIERPGDSKLSRGGYRARVDRARVACEVAHRLLPARRQRDGLEQPRGKWMVSLVNSHTKATRIGWHLWEIDLRFAPGLPPGWRVFASRS